jgi:hypothetical protein
MFRPRPRPAAAAAAGALFLLVALTFATVARSATGPSFILTLGGPVPMDQEFVLYVQTDPPTLDQTRFNFCYPANTATSPKVTFAVCRSGEEYGLFPASFKLGTVVEFRYERWDDGRPFTFYEGRVTITEDNRTPTFRVVYDYSLTLPDTAMPPRASSPPAVAVAMLTLLAVLRVPACRPGQFAKQALHRLSDRLRVRRGVRSG